MTYGFPNVSTTTGTVDPGPAPTLTGLSLGTFSAVGLSASPNASGRFSFTGWPVGAQNGADNYGTYTAALSPFSYYEFVIGIQPGYTLELQGIRFDVRRSGTGVRNYCVRSDLDNYNSNLAASTGTSTKLSVIPGNIFFWNFDSISTSNDQHGSTVSPGPSFTNLTQSLHFRIYAWNSESIAGSFSIDNLSLTGKLTDSTLLASLKKIGGDDHPFSTSYFPIAAELQLLVLENCSGLELFDAAGRRAFQRETIKKGELIRIPNLEPGIYHLRSLCNKRQLAFKIGLF